jgi:hypothetical protein
MKPEKYSRSVTLLCPTCGGGSFETRGPPDEAVQMTRCASCGREATKDDLIRENSENISEHVKEMGAEIAKDFADEMHKTLKNAFRGSKFIKIK